MLVESVSKSASSNSLSTGNGSLMIGDEEGQSRCLLDQDTYHRMSSGGSTFDINSSNSSDTDSSGEESTSSGGMHFFEGAEKRLVLYLSGGNGPESKGNQKQLKTAVNGGAMKASEMALSAGESVNQTKAKGTLAKDGQMDKQYGPGPDLRTIPR